MTQRLSLTSLLLIENLVSTGGSDSFPHKPEGEHVPCLMPSFKGCSISYKSRGVASETLQGCTRTRTQLPLLLLTVHTMK